MEKNKRKTSPQLQKYLPSIKRFAVPLLGLLSLFVLIQTLINIDSLSEHDLNGNYLMNIWLHLSLLLVPIGIGAQLFFESHKEQRKSNIIAGAATSLGLALLYLAQITKNTEVPNENIYRTITIYLALLAMSLLLPYLKGRSWQQIWQYIYKLIFNAFIAVAFSVAISIGIGLALLGFDQLLNIEPNGEVVIFLYSSIWILFLPISFLWRFPSNFQEVFDIKKYNKLNRYFFYYIALPFITIYSIILGILMVRILADWSLPENQISYLTLIFTLPGTVSLFALKPILEKDKPKFISLFYNVYPIFSILVAILFAAAVVVRVNTYGYTPDRFYLIIVGTLIFGINFILAFKLDWLFKYLFISAFLAIAFSIIPYINIFNISETSQLNRFEKMLVEDGILVDGEIVKKYSDIYYLDYEPKYKYYSQVRYLIENHGYDSLDSILDLNDLEYRGSYRSYYDIVDNHIFTSTPPQQNKEEVKEDEPVITPTKKKSSLSTIYLSNKANVYNADTPINTKGYNYAYEFKVGEVYYENITKRKISLNSKKYLISATNKGEIFINDIKVESFNLSDVITSNTTRSFDKPNQDYKVSLKDEQLTIPFRADGLEGVFVITDGIIEWDTVNSQVRDIPDLDIVMLFNRN